MGFKRNRAKGKKKPFFGNYIKHKSFPGGKAVKNLLQETKETWVRSLGWEDPLEQEMATHSSILAWEILWAEEPGGLSSWGRRFGHESPTEHIKYKCTKPSTKM